MSDMSYCPKCGRKLEPSDVEGYEFVCFNCDENFYSFEAVERFSPTGFTCPKCGNTEYFTAFAIVLYGPTLIHPDGWNWFGGSFDSELAPEAIMRCEKCEHEAKHYEFEQIGKVMGRDYLDG